MLPDKLFAEPALYLLCFGRGGVVIECCPLDVVCSFFCCGVAVPVLLVQLPFIDLPQKNSFNRLNIDMGGCVCVLMSIISQMYDYFTEYVTRLRFFAYNIMMAALQPPSLCLVLIPYPFAMITHVCVSFVCFPISSTRIVGLPVKVQPNSVVIGSCVYFIE